MCINIKAKSRGFRSVLLQCSVLLMGNTCALFIPKLFIILTFYANVFFYQEDNELRLVPGDELRLRYPGDSTHAPWQSVGHVVRFLCNCR